jgi:hypothetical protein
MPAGKVTTLPQPSDSANPNLDALYGTRAIEAALLGDLFASDDPVAAYHYLAQFIDAASWTSDARRKIWLASGNVVSLGEPLTVAMVFENLVKHNWVDGTSLVEYRDHPKLVDSIRDAYVRKMAETRTHNQRPQQPGGESG